MSPKLYIGNLSPSVSEAELRRLFSKAGAVSEVQMMLDPATSQPRGCAYVTMATPELAAAALREFHGYNLGGRYISVTEGRPPQEPKGLMREGFALGSAASFRVEVPERRKRQRDSGGAHRRRRGR